ncbi:MAG: PKD-like domain-containing protein [Dysgonomonas sp.]
MNNKCLLIFISFLFIFLSACSDSNNEEILAPIISGLDDKYIILEEDALELEPVIINGNSANYKWHLNGLEVANTSNYTFKGSVVGSYKLVLNATNTGGSTQKEIEIIVVKRDSPPIITNLEEKYIIDFGTKQKLSPLIVSDSEVTYLWLLENEAIADTRDYTFNATQAGIHKLLLKVTNEEGITEKEIIIIVNGESLKIETSTYTILSLEAPTYLNNIEDIKWEVLDTPSNLYRLSSADSKMAMFIAAKTGEYNLQVTDGEIKSLVKITVKKAEKQLSSYISKVFDYLPAPGQFVNKLPEYTEGDTHADMIRKANEWLVGEDAWMITLGGWGGYVTVGFDHTIINVSGKRDFRINGNAFGANYGRPGAPFGGSCEPGIIMVAYDKNKNGKPDEDEWYEIKGSSNFSADGEPWFSYAKENKNDTKVYRDYEMTYYKPTKENPEIIGEPDNPNAYMTIEQYIRWKDNKNNSGYKVKNIYHQQTYYPAWIKEDQLSFKGIRLPENGINEGKYIPDINEGSTYFVLYGFRYGYVDNYPNLDDNSGIDIDWAIDKNGNKVDLPGIDFVKIYNGVNQENGWLGECSTEVERGEDLHMLGKSINTINE